MSDSEDTPKVSKYNSAVNQLMRLDELWKDAHRHSRSGKYHLWNADLDCIWSELSRDLEKGCDEDKEYNDFTIKIANAGSVDSGKIWGFKSSPTNPKHYAILREKEIWLGRLQNKLGKGTSWSDEDEDLIE